ncbi:MAG TPA: hypothetical protein PLZ45_02655 [Ferruginibacter sp.]|nr:hypothetical protein [Chitinophagaceae bacterium]HRI23544.1 hypothetical protein [Ferruginibacter sp.]
MRVFILFGALIILLSSFSSFKNRQIKYLPVFVSFSDTTSFHAEIALDLKAVFSIRKIKVISRSDAEAYMKSEGEAIAEAYLRSGGDIKNFDQFKLYQSANARPVANSLSIKIDISPEGIINDTVKWVSHTIPIVFSNPPKGKWRIMILNDSNAKTILQMSQSIVDSIIASKVLAVE